MEDRLTVLSRGPDQTATATGSKTKEEDKLSRSPAAQAASAPTKEKSAPLTASEKLTFGVAAIFSTAILVVCVFLTVVGFIFSPITHTLLFGVLMGASGITSYVIWRGGRRNAG